MEMLHKLLYYTVYNIKTRKMCCTWLVERRAFWLLFFIVFDIKLFEFSHVELVSMNG